MSNKAFNKLLSLLSEERLRESTSGKRGLLIASESDKGRVINSAAFRRLQQKAQVFPLEPNAAVRTRLTHSIEVSQIGRHLAQKIIENSKSTSPDYNKLAAFVNTIETACLLHDIGNPPFGHLGESAIREWFSTAQTGIPDLEDFDGNPQGFRLMSFLSGADKFGFNLTCTLLLATVKYPWDTHKKPSNTKPGVFSEDLENYKNACNRVGWNPGSTFPIARLMDTADQIAYSMSDLEDGLEKRIITEDELKKEFGADKFPQSTIKPFIAFKTNTINQAVNMAARRFTDDLEGVLIGEELDLIDSASETGDLLKKIGKFARARIYSDEAAEQVELAGRSVLKGLLNHFGELIKISEDDFSALLTNNREAIKDKKLDFQLRLLRRLPIKYCEKYSETNHGEEIYRRAHLIVDFISGMTDDFALQTYQILEGIRIK